MTDNPFHLCFLPVGGQAIEMNLPEAAHLTEYAQKTPIFQLMLHQEKQHLAARLKAEEGEEVEEEEEAPEMELVLPASEIEAIVLLLARSTAHIPDFMRKHYRGWWARRTGEEIVSSIWLFSAHYMIHHNPSLQALLDGPEPEDGFEAPEPITQEDDI